MKPLLRLDYNSKFWSPIKADSYNCTMNGIEGARGLGKTTGVLIKGTKNYFNDGSQFVYIRRYKNELKQFKNKRTLNSIFDGYLYSGDGSGGSVYKVQDDIAGYGIPLSIESEYKSSDFSRVTLIIFDEAILLRGSTIRYLDKEIEAFWELIGTIVRLRKNYKIFILGNNLDLFNPYFEFFNVPLFEDKYVDTKRGVYFEKAKDSEELRKDEEQTPLYKLLNGTSYGDYYYNNKLINSNLITTGNKPSNCSFICRIRVEDETINVYRYNDSCNKSKLYFERRDKPIDDDTTYSIVKNGQPNYYDGTLFRQKLFPYISRYFYKNECLYTDQRAGDLISYVMDLTK